VADTIWQTLPSVLARAALMGGDASLGSTDARILGCARSTCFKPSTQGRTLKLKETFESSSSPLSFNR
jgi:hypothetical protein